MDDRDRVHGPGAFLRRPAILATVAGLTLALVLGGLAWNASQPTGDGSANATHRPGTSSPRPSMSDDPWASLEPTATIAPPIAANDTATGELAALGAPGAVVPLDATLPPGERGQHTCLHPRVPLVDPPGPRLLCRARCRRPGRRHHAGRAPAPRRRLSLRTRWRGRSTPRLVGVPGGTAATHRGNAPGRPLHRRPDRYRDRGHLRPGRVH